MADIGLQGQPEANAVPGLQCPVEHRCLSRNEANDRRL